MELEPGYRDEKILIRTGDIEKLIRDEAIELTTEPDSKTKDAEKSSLLPKILAIFNPHWRSERHTFYGSIEGEFAVLHRNGDRFYIEVQKK